MAHRSLNTVVRHIHRLAGHSPDAAPSDRALLERFIARRDQEAFTLLLERHGPMVRGVCQRLLGQSTDVDDAFQATFLLLVRKAGSIRKAESVASWLYGVAYRIASRLKSSAARQFVSERMQAQRKADDPALQAAWRELCALLDQEVQCLAESYRAPLVLCYLEGQTRDQAARQLGWSLRTLDRRLTKGRELLRLRLCRRGLTLSAGLLTAALAQHVASAAVPITLFDTTLKAATLIAGGELIASAAAGRAAELVHEGLRAMFWTKLHTAALFTILAAGIAGGGALFLGGGGAPAQDKNADHAVPAQAAAAGGGLPDDSDSEQPSRRTKPRPPDQTQAARERVQSVNNLKQLALAMINYADTYRRLPPPAIYSGQRSERGFQFRNQAPVEGENSGSSAGSGPGAPGAPTAGTARGAGAGAPLKGRALLSWRVMLLPFLEEDALYKEFKLNEPWDSPHNRKLLARMPKVYAPVGELARQYPGSTFYQVFVGPGGGFEKHTALRYPVDIPDGTSNTIMIVEAGRPVPWTKPEDLPFDPDEPLPEPGGMFKDLFHAAFFDGSVHTFRKDADEEVLRAAITRSGGEVIDFSRLSAQPARGAGTASGADRADLAAENQTLKDTYRALKELLADEMVKAAQENEQEDKETARLREENRMLREGVARLEKEIKALRTQHRQIKEKLGPGPKK